MSLNVPSLTLGLEESEDVVLANGALDVADDGAGRVVHELDADLGDSSAGSSAAENLDNLGEVNLRLRGLLITYKPRSNTRERVSARAGRLEWDLVG